MTVEELVRDVRTFYDLHLEAGGVPNEPGNNSNAGYQGNQGNSGGKQLPLGPNLNTNLSGQKRSFTSPPVLLNKDAFDRLPSNILRGGSVEARGQHAQCVCVLCFRMGHTFEFCATHNGFNMRGGKPVESLPNGYRGNNFVYKGTGYQHQRAIQPAPPVKRLTQ
jgi:hypothetical protein